MHDVIGVAQRRRYELGQVQSLKRDVTIGTGEGEGAQGTQGEHGIMQGMAL